MNNIYVCDITGKTVHGIADTFPIINLTPEVRIRLKVQVKKGPNLWDGGEICPDGLEQIRKLLEPMIAGIPAPAGAPAPAPAAAPKGKK